MRSLTLPETDIRTTALGFGTASLMGKLNRSESLRLLNIAYDQGIRHFDTAPAYGFGEAEAVLGAFRRTHPDITVATKFGLSRPKTGSAAFRLAKQVARPLLRAFPSLRRSARQTLQARTEAVTDFSVDSARTSLAVSLKNLGGDYVDILLLHECRATDLSDDNLLAFLTQARQDGRVRAFGIGTDISTVAYCVESARSYASVLQFANNPNEPNLQRIPSLSAHACITHSPFGGVGKATAESLQAAMIYAKEQNPLGVILFSSQHEPHIVENVRAFEGGG